MKKTILLLTCFALIAGGGFGLSKAGLFDSDTKQPDTAPKPENASERSAFSFTETVHDFGEVPAGTPVRHTFTFTNTGQAELRIENVKPACSCSVADFTKTPVAPGETGKVVAEYNAKKPGVFNKSFSVITNPGSQPTILKIKGEVVK